MRLRLPLAPCSRKCTLEGCSGAPGDSVPARFDAPLWPRVDRGDFGERSTLRLDSYRLRRAADGEGDWCVTPSALLAFLVFY